MRIFASLSLAASRSSISHRLSTSPRRAEGAASHTAGGADAADGLEQLELLCREGD